MDLKISPKSVQQETVRKLRDAVMVGHFRPGERLVEADLCEQLGVSRSSVREALRVLATEHVVVITPNRGPSVADISWEEAEQIYRVRALLEGELSSLAAQQASEADLVDLKRELKLFAKAVEAQDPLTRISSTTAFYEVIIRCSGNRIMGDLIHGLIARINFLRARTMANPGRAKHSVREMSLLCDAITAHDPRSARAAAVAHVQAACEEARDVYHQIKGVA